MIVNRRLGVFFVSPEFSESQGYLDPISPFAGNLRARIVARNLVPSTNLVLNSIFRRLDLWPLHILPSGMPSPLSRTTPIGDIESLSLAVSATAGRSWHLRFCGAGKQKRMSLNA